MLGLIYGGEAAATPNHMDGKSMASPRQKRRQKTTSTAPSSEVHKEAIPEDALIYTTF